MGEHEVVCRTVGCVNADVGIVILRPAELVICGVCGNQITDIAPEIPEGGYPPEE